MIDRDAPLGWIFRRAKAFFNDTLKLCGKTCELIILIGPLRTAGMKLIASNYDCVNAPVR